MPTISSASVRLATPATDTSASSTIASPLLLVLPAGRSWHHRRTSGGLVLSAAKERQQQKEHVEDGVMTAHGRLHQAGGKDGHGRPVRLVPAAELLQGDQLSPQGAVEVADDR